MVRLPVRKFFASVSTKSQNASTFCPYNLSFCTNQITKKFVFLSVQLFLLYQPNHKSGRFFVRKSFASVSTKSQKSSSFCPFNFSFCTSQITNWFGFLSVKVLLLYQPNHKTLQLSVRIIYLSLLTNSQKGSSFCPYNFSFCTSQITNWFDCLSVKVFLLYQPNHRKVRLSGRIIYPSVLTNSQKSSSFSPYNLSFCTNQITKRFVFLYEQLFLLYQLNHKSGRFFVRKSFASVSTKSQKSSSFCPFNFSFCTSQITNWFCFLSVKVLLLYQPNHKTLQLSVRIIYPSVLTNSQKSSSFCPYNFSFCTSQITNWFGFLSGNVSRLYQPNHKMLRFSVRTIYPSVLINSQKCSNFCPYNFFCTSQIIHWFSFCPYNFSFCTNRITKIFGFPSVHLSFSTNQFTKRFAFLSEELFILY